MKGIKVYTKIAIVNALPMFDLTVNPARDPRDVTHSNMYSFLYVSRLNTKERQHAQKSFGSLQNMCAIKNLFSNLKAPLFMSKI